MTATHQAWNKAIVDAERLRATTGIARRRPWRDSVRIQAFIDDRSAFIFRCI